MDNFTPYTEEDLKGMSHEELAAVALDKRQEQGVRVAAMQKRPDDTTLSLIIQDSDDSEDIRDIAREMLENRRLAATAVAGLEANDGGPNTML